MIGSKTAGIVCLVIVSATFVAQAGVIYDFQIFSNDFWKNDDRLGFTITASDEGQNKVGFLFENSSLITSSITAIYFDDDSILNLAEGILEGTGVNFAFGATPKSLPAGNNLIPPFDKKPAFSADSDSPTSHNGINQAEWLKITFTLKTGKNFDDVTNAIARGGTTSQHDLRIGIHIQSLPNDDSVSAINYPTPIENSNPLPEPATLGLLAFGSLAFVIKKR
ncbi:MAG: PEP-CTERM sorting domain-containing protein [Phycisphaerae bacterium]|nr:PEP-CTERM sorting domain-containing protein [Phycisphaerae bacterium]